MIDMMKRLVAHNLIRSAILALGLLPGFAHAQSSSFPQTMPPNTLAGRLGVSAGPIQAIPFAAFFNNLSLPSGKVWIGSAGNLASPQTISGDGTLSPAGVLALATVNTNPGASGSATQCVTVTNNAKGLTTAVSAATCTPAIGSVTGLGTGIATALVVNVGTAGSVVVNGGALGTPSSGTLTSATGLPISTGLTGAGTGVLTALGVNIGSAGAFTTFNGAHGTPSSIVLTNATGLPYAALPSLAANQLLGALTATTPSGQSVPSCSTASSALQWTSGTGFACNTSITAAAVPASGLTGTILAGVVTASSLTSLGTLTSLGINLAPLSGIDLQVSSNGVVAGGEATNKGNIRINSGQADAASNGLEFKASGAGSGYGFRAATVFDGASNMDLKFQNRQNAAGWTDIFKFAGLDGTMSVLGGVASTSSTTGTIKVTGGAGVSGAIWAGTYINITPTVVASLPACTAGLDGARAYVTNNATATAFAGAVTTGGANHHPVYCDGSATAWKQG